MFLNLVIKEFKNGIVLTKFKKSNFLNIILSVLVSISFVVLEIYLYTNLNEKLMAFEGASKAFLNVFLFVISILVILYLTNAVRKTVYSKEDSMNLLSKPVSDKQNILSKIVFIYIRNVVTDILIALPILLIYGNQCNVGSRVFFLMSLYPIVISIFETGVAFLLSTPYQMIYNFLQKHYIVQVITSLLIMVGLCFAYAEILNTFLALVRDNNIYAIFSEATINNLSTIADYLIPTKYYIQLLNLNFLGVLHLLSLSLIIFILGTSISARTYLRSINNDKNNKAKKKKINYKLCSQDKALLKKELAICFQDSNDMFSFSSLLVIQPFLTVLVIHAMNTIFKTGLLSYVTSYFPYLTPLIQILFIVLFATFINTSACFVISREKYQGICICKTIPVSYKKLLFIKMVVPFTLSIISLFTTIIALLVTRQVNAINSLLGLLFAILMSALLEVLSVSSDIKAPSKEEETSNKAALISFYSIIIPVLCVALMFILTYVGLPFIGSFFIVVFVLMILEFIYFMSFIKNITKRFVALEMRN